MCSPSVSGEFDAWLPVRVTGLVGRLFLDGGVPHDLAGLSIETEHGELVDLLRARVHRGRDVDPILPDDRRGVASSGNRHLPADVLLLAPLRRRTARGGHAGPVRTAPVVPPRVRVLRKGTGEPGREEQGSKDGSAVLHARRVRDSTVRAHQPPDSRHLHNALTVPEHLVVRLETAGVHARAVSRSTRPSPAYQASSTSAIKGCPSRAVRARCRRTPDPNRGGIGRGSVLCPRVAKPGR